MLFQVMCVVQQQLWHKCAPSARLQTTLWHPITAALVAACCCMSLCQMCPLGNVCTLKSAQPCIASGAEGLVAG